MNGTSYLVAFLSSNRSRRGQEGQRMAELSPTLASVVPTEPPSEEVNSSILEVAQISNDGAFAEKLKEMFLSPPGSATEETVTDVRRQLLGVWPSLTVLVHALRRELEWWCVIKKLPTADAKNKDDLVERLGAAQREEAVEQALLAEKKKSKKRSSKEVLESDMISPIMEPSKEEQQRKQMRLVCYPYPSLMHCFVF